MSAATDRRPRRVAGIYRPPVNASRMPPPRPGPLAQLVRTANTVRAQVERGVLRDEGLTWTTYDVLVLVCARRAVETRTAAAEVGIAKATLTNALVSLVDRGLVRRDLQEDDRRRVVLRPTQAGMDLARRVQGPVEAEQARLFGEPGMPSGDSLARVLRSLATRSRQDGATDEPDATR
ncbi:MarR family transcriptional regulator [Micromonospora sp. MED01]|uniref:MarR family winged helix-turn-helix transcriptional regulator n=1 Tax=Micromonospora alfalfae TaxID=2911212 RepID=UPI001EE89B08|nr:MarR family transcriptional regulator [Micromonospora alfalfae]MCG5466734.1 MarR family transcriptional regulator [Micromonospora alfalfae]